MYPKPMAMKYSRLTLRPLRACGDSSSGSRRKMMTAATEMTNTSPRIAIPKFTFQSMPPLSWPRNTCSGFRVKKKNGALSVTGKPDATFKAGLYGEGTASDDLSVHQWNVLCLDRASGKVLWERTAYQGVPKEK